MTVARITRSRARRCIRLLHMRYKPSEIAREVGVTVDTVYRSYLPAGAPHEKDTAGNIWIVGDIFAKWVYEYAITRSTKPARLTLEDNQAYCLRCNQAVEIVTPRTSRPNMRGVVNISGRCPLCGGKINRLRKSAKVQK